MPKATAVPPRDNSMTSSLVVVLIGLAGTCSGFIYDTKHVLSSDSGNFILTEGPMFSAEDVRCLVLLQLFGLCNSFG
jgi:hypothetical protein